MWPRRRRWRRRRLQVSLRIRWATLVRLVLLLVLPDPLHRERPAQVGKVAIIQNCIPVSLLALRPAQCVLGGRYTEALAEERLRLPM